MKRKESVERSKPNNNLANQLKARLFDKGSLRFIQVSATAPSPQSNDKSKIITPPNPTKTQP